MGSRHQEARQSEMDTCSKEIDKPDKNRNISQTSCSRVPDYCQSIRVTDVHGHVKELLFPRALDLDRPKRSRTTFSSNQLKDLEDEFQRNQYLAGRDRTALADKLGLTETQIKVWFQNRRTKHKREKVRDLEFQRSKAESTATCNVLRLLQQNSSPQVNLTSSTSGFSLFAPFTSAKM